MVSKYYTLNGKVGRAKLLQTILIAFVLVIGAWLIDERFVSPNLCEINEDWICYLPGEVREGLKLEHIAALLVAFPLFSVMVRRLHDHSKSGWWLLIAFTVIGILPLLYWFLTKSKAETNPYN